MFQKFLIFILIFWIPNIKLANCEDDFMNRSEDSHKKEIEQADKFFTYGSNKKQHLAYSCNLRDNLVYSEYSLLQVEKCGSTSGNYEGPILKDAQLLQSKEFETIHVIHCSLAASFITSYCSYNYLTGWRQWNGITQISNVQLHLSKTECTNAVKDGKLRYMDRKYYNRMVFIDIDLPLNGQGDGTIVLRGEVNSRKGTCEGDSFSLDGDFYGSHVLQMRYSIKIKQNDGILNLEKQVLRLNPHLVISEIRLGSFYDPELGNFHWQTINPGNYSANQWLQIARGNLKLYNPRTNNTKSIGIFQNNRTSIALTLEDTVLLCLKNTCKNAYKTALSKIFIVIKETGQSFWKLDSVQGSHVSRFADIKSSSSSLFLNRELALDDAFDQVSYLLCQRSRDLILSNMKNFLDRVHREEGHSEGQYLIPAGSVIYSIKCHIQTIWLSPNNSKCYKDPKVNYYQGKVLKTGFVDPISHVIKPSSTETSCEDTLPFKIALRSLDNKLEWMCRKTRGWSTACKPPQKLQPLHPGLLYKADTSIIHSNLYSKDQLDALDDLQWKENKNSKVTSQLLHYVEDMKNKHPELEFEQFLDKLLPLDFLDYLNFAGWLESLKEKMLNLILISYTINVLYHLWNSTKNIKKFKRKSNYPKIAIDAIWELWLAFFPITMRNKQRKCPCMQDNYREEIHKYIEEKEREKFLKHLSL